MAAFFFISQQVASNLPSRIAPAQYKSSIHSGIIGLCITGAIAVSVLLLLGFKKYQQYRYQQQVKILERQWQQPLQVAWQQRKRVTTTPSPDQIPCQSCLFFHENHYLKCAVHPKTVLTQQSINCQDYISNEETYFG